jgi:hypothetical protein
MLTGAIAVTALAVAGCSGPADDVATLEEDKAFGPSSTEGLSDLEIKQHKTAEAFATCLEDQGWGVERMLQTPVGYEGMMFKGYLPKPHEKPYGAAISFVGGTVLEGVEIDTHKTGLVIQGVDKTEQLQACIDSTGYFVPEPIFDPREEAQEKQEIVDVSNAWAQCARNNGFPNTRDATVAVDNWETVPEAVLPGSITVGQMKALVQVCPPIDPDTDPTKGPNQQAMEGVVLLHPRIEFDLGDGDPKRDDLRAVIDQYSTDLYEAAHGTANPGPSPNP